MQFVSSLFGLPISAASAAYAPTNSAEVSAVASAFSTSKLDASASSQFLTSLPADVVYSADITAFAYESSLSSKLDATASSQFLTAVPDGYATTAYVESSVSGKLDSTASSQFITAIPDDVVRSDELTAYAHESSLSSKLDASASSQFITALPEDYVTTAYVESSISGKLDATASSQFLTAIPADYATTAYVDSSVSSKLDATASSQFLTSTAGLVGTADLSAYAYESSNSAKLDTSAFSTVSSNFLTSIPSDYATTAYVDSSISGFAYESAVSGWTAKQDALTFEYDDSNNISSIDGFALAGVASLPISGYDDPDQGLSLASARYCVSEMSLYHSSYIGDLEHSAANGIAIYPNRISMQNDTDGVVTDVDIYMSSVNLWDSAASSVSSKQDTLTFGYDGSNNISSIDGSALAGGGEYSGVAPIIVDNSAKTISMSGAAITSDNTISIVQSGANVAILVNESALTSKLDKSASGMFQASGEYLSASESSNYYSTSNPSGFISTADMSNYATTAELSGYMQTSESSNFIPTSESSEFQLTADMGYYQQTADMSAYLGTAESGNYQLKSNMSAYQPKSAMDQYIPTSQSSEFQLKSDMGSYQTVDNMSSYMEKSDSALLIPTSESGKFQLTSHMDAYALNSTLVMNYQPLSGMTAYQQVQHMYNYQQTADMSAYQKTADMGSYQTTADMTSYLQKSASSMFIPTGESSNYQQTADMTAYQPAGAYIYASALGIGEI